MADTWKCSKREFKDYWINTLSSDVNLQIADGLIPGLYLRYSRRTSQISFFLGCTPKTIGKRVNLFMGKLTDYDSVATIREKAKAWRNLILCASGAILLNFSNNNSNMPTPAPNVHPMHPAP